MKSKGNRMTTDAAPPTATWSAIGPVDGESMVGTLWDGENACGSYRAIPCGSRTMYYGRWTVNDDPFMQGMAISRVRRENPADRSLRGSCG